jgi:DsbC/DsbD-like thiol-disulfide interchange protein
MLPILSCFFLTALPTLAQQPGKEVPDGNKLVRVSLMADRDAIKPGETFTLGVKLRIERGWHIYWENCGDAGLPTSADVRAPDGFKVGPVRFPAPERLEAEGKLVMFVHTGETVLLVDVTAPKDWKPTEPARFSVEANWLVCIKECYAGAGSAALTLALATDAKPATPANAALFTAARAKLPLPMDKLGALIVLGTEKDGEHTSVILRLNRQNPELLAFFPALNDEWDFVSYKSEVIKHGGEQDKWPSGMLRLEFRQHDGAKPRDYHFSGVIRIDKPDTTTSYNFEYRSPIGS